MPKAPTLAESAASNAEVARILEQQTRNTDAVHQIGLLGVNTSEAAVRRYRKTLADRPPATKPLSEAVPKGWENFAEEYGKIGKAGIMLPSPGATEHDLLIGAGFNPDCWKISGNVNTRRWMRYDHEWLYYYKFDVAQGESQASKEAHVGDLVKMIRKRKVPGPKFANLSHPSAYVFVMSDWQIGKAENGKGSADTVARFKDCLAQAKQNIIALRKMGVLIDRLAIVGTGDLVEGCKGHYDMQTFSVDLDRRSQNRVVRELITLTILTLSPMFSMTDLAFVGGNHGENRDDGKSFTTFADNDDVGAPEAVKEAFDLAGWTHLNWTIPDEELSICVNLGGVKVGLVHGHQFKGGVNALKKAEDWWRSNVFGLEPVNDAQILLSGHFHHFCAVNVTAGRTWLQAPTIDPGSKWYTDSTGITATPGVLSFVVTPHSPVGYDHLRVLIPSDADLTS